MPIIDYEPFDNQSICTSSEHDPPNMRVYKPGRYTYKCPKCGKITKFVVGPSPRLDKTEHRLSKML